MLSGSGYLYSDSDEKTAATIRFDKIYANEVLVISPK